MNAGKLAAIVALGLIIVSTASGAVWNVRKQQGRDYVSFGDVAEFYHFGQYRHANRTVSLQSDRRGLRAQAGTSEFFINGVRFFTDFPLVSQGDDTLVSAVDVGKIIEPVLRPSRIASAAKVETVILDPGHGGMDQGTANQWGSESKFALAAALSAREQLRHAGYQVEMTRTADVAVSLEDRVAFANRFPHAVFISIHFNSGGGAGAESYLLAPDGVPSNASAEHHVSAAESQPNEGNTQDGANVALAAAVHAAVLTQLVTFDRGVRHARFKVLRDIRVPAVLLEAGFLTDSAEGRRIATPLYQQQLGGAIAMGVRAYDAAVNYRAPNATFSVAQAKLPPHTHSITEPLISAPSSEPSPAQQPSVSINGGR
ncbi:MAG: N-acetylmuramoyl-L-alanine amidase [Chthoniobacterales bacterium]